MRQTKIRERLSNTQGSDWKKYRLCLDFSPPLTGVKEQKARTRPSFIQNSFLYSEKRMPPVAWFQKTTFFNRLFFSQSSYPQALHK